MGRSSTLNFTVLQLPSFVEIALNKITFHGGDLWKATATFTGPYGEAIVGIHGYITIYNSLGNQLAVFHEYTNANGQISWEITAGSVSLPPGDYLVDADWEGNSEYEGC